MLASLCAGQLACGLQLREALLLGIQVLNAQVSFLFLDLDSCQDYILLPVLLRYKPLYRSVVALLFSSFRWCGKSSGC